jgi:ribose 5-phosphate isomerase B
VEQRESATSIAIGSDHAGFALKNILKARLEEWGYQVKDYGCYSEEPVNYPRYAQAVAEAVAAGEHERGVLICGTGIGMAITANKVAGIRAAQCHDVHSAERARKSNDAQIMTMGARVIGTELAKALLRVWLDSEFAGEVSPSYPKVQEIMQVEAKYLRKA